MIRVAVSTTNFAKPKYLFWHKNPLDLRNRLTSSARDFRHSKIREPVENLADFRIARSVRAWQIFHHLATFPARRAAFEAARFCALEPGRPHEPAARRPIFFAVFSMVIRLSCVSILHLYARRKMESTKKI